ncbi:acetylxylan esterase [Ruania suaedae]|uniref:acetylxylan esterase n=1 Tax=Ruania suaedae TaxID=2897774 RepID=UPI001E33D6B5|nr:acetylxylan esterase [Ruania suaedae]UFU03574.1 acetylxylan esterase [Ruania suaedae]
MRPVEDAAAADPGRLAIRAHRPADFDEYWASSLRYLDRTDPAAVSTHRPDMSTPEVDVFDLRFDSAGDVRVAGWYARPAGEHAPGSLPGLLVIPGYISDPIVPTAFAAAGYAVCSVAPRGKVRSRDQVNPGYPGLLVDGLLDPWTSTYRSFYLDVVRAFDVLRAMPEVDDDRVGVHGSSQGGGLGVLVGALRAGSVAAVSAGAPFMCGVMDSVRLTRTYPYQEVRELLQQDPGLLEAVTEAAGYLDCLNLAGSVRCPTQVYIGLGDDVCPPETGYALVEALTGAPTELLAWPGCGHDAGLPWMSEHIDRFLASHLRPAGARVEADLAGSNA